MFCFVWLLSSPLAPIFDFVWLLFLASRPYVLFCFNVIVFLEILCFLLMLSTQMHLFLVCPMFGFVCLFFSYFFYPMPYVWFCLVVFIFLSYVLCLVSLRIVTMHMYMYMRMHMHMYFTMYHARTTLNCYDSALICKSSIREGKYKI